MSVVSEGIPPEAHIELSRITPSFKPYSVLRLEDGSTYFIFALSKDGFPTAFSEENEPLLTVINSVAQSTLEKVYSSENEDDALFAHRASCLSFILSEDALTIEADLPPEDTTSTLLKTGRNWWNKSIGRFTGKATWGHTPRSTYLISSEVSNECAPLFAPVKTLFAESPLFFSEKAHEKRSEWKEKALERARLLEDGSAEIHDDARHFALTKLLENSENLSLHPELITTPSSISGIDQSLFFSGNDVIVPLVLAEPGRPKETAVLYFQSEKPGQRFGSLDAQPGVIYIYNPTGSSRDLVKKAATALIDLRTKYNPLLKRFTIAPEPEVSPEAPLDLRGDRRSFAFVKAMADGKSRGDSPPETYASFFAAPPPYEPILSELADAMRREVGA